MAAASRSGHAEVLRGLALLAIASVVSLALLEAGLAFVRPRDLIGRWPPGKHIVTNHEFTERLTINRFGLREARFNPRPWTRRVLLLGDSFVEGTGQSDEETIAWQLNSGFPGKEYQFFNAGVTGTDVSDYAEVYRKVTASVSTAFSSTVIFFFIGNDFLDYERIAGVKRRRDEQRRDPQEAHGLVRVLTAVLPNTVEAMRELRRDLSPRAERPDTQPYSAMTHIERFDENHDYFERPPLSDAEKRRLEERFERIPPESRTLIGQGLINRWCYHVYVTDALNDFIYNMNSAYNEKVFMSTMRQLDRLIRTINGDVSIVLIPDKFQVSDDERRVAREIIGAGVRDDEFVQLLNVNARIMSWLSEHHPTVRTYDASSDLLTPDPNPFYYRIDGHMTPAGAAIIAEGIARRLP